jgi:hypothetical protein
MNRLQVYVSGCEMLVDRPAELCLHEPQEKYGINETVLGTHEPLLYCYSSFTSWLYEELDSVRVDSIRLDSIRLDSVR